MKLAVGLPEPYAPDLLSPVVLLPLLNDPLPLSLEQLCSLPHLVTHSNYSVTYSSRLCY
jgi:hypothetical protein